MVDMCVLIETGQAHPDIDFFQLCSSDSAMIHK